MGPHAWSGSFTALARRAADGVVLRRELAYSRARQRARYGGERSGPDDLANPIYEGGTMRRTVMADSGPAPVGPYSHAVVANGFVFVSGQGPVDPETGDMPDGFADQVRQTLENLRTILEAAGSSLDDVVKVNAYVTDLTRFAEFNEVYKEFFRNDPPARTTVATALLGILVEVDCIAQLEESG